MFVHSCARGYRCACCYILFTYNACLLVAEHLAKQSEGMGIVQRKVNDMQRQTLVQD